MGVFDVIGALTRAGARGARATGATVKSARTIAGVGNPAMMRLLDLHAVSCAGDTLVVIGVAGSMFLSAPVGQARTQVALYLLVAVIPFALIAGILGPIFDRLHYGRVLLVTTMIGRALLAWSLVTNLGGFARYQLVFAILVLSRGYAVARAATLARLVPQGLRPSQAGARVSFFGTAGGAVAVVVGLVAFEFDPTWPLVLAGLVFVAGTVLSLLLPAPTATVVRSLRTDRSARLATRHLPTTGSVGLVGVAETAPQTGTASQTGPAARRDVMDPLTRAYAVGGAVLRALCGALLVFVAFAVRGGAIGTGLGTTLGLVLIAAAFAFGTFLATAIGSALTIRRPLTLLIVCLALTAPPAAWATARPSLFAALALCMVAALAAGLARLAVDAAIGERMPASNRATAEAHVETLLFTAWALGAAAGLIPLDARLVFGGATLLPLAAVVALAVARSLRRATGSDPTVQLGGGATATVPRGPTPPGPVPPGPVPPAPVPPAPVPPGTVPAARPSPTPTTPITFPDYPGGLADASTSSDPAPPGFHVFSPSPPDDGVPDPRSG
jgi:hypothetical protein